MQSSGVATLGMFRMILVIPFLRGQERAVKAAAKERRNDQRQLEPLPTEERGKLRKSIDPLHL